MGKFKMVCKCSLNLFKFWEMRVIMLVLWGWGDNLEKIIFFGVMKNFILKIFVFFRVLVMVLAIVWVWVSCFWVKGVGCYDF